MGYLARDLQLAAKFVGVQMRVFDHLGDTVSARLSLERYCHVLNDFCTRKLDDRGLSASILMHLNYPYNGTNRDYWYKFSLEMKPVLQGGLESLENKEIYIVSMEDVNNDEEK